MTASTPETTPLIGYLTFAELDDCGVVGGYLLVNQFARPVEFHCSAPLRPNRAQEILYGPTLRPFLYSEQIGLTLVQQSQQTVQVLITDEELALGLRSLVNVPLALLLGKEHNGAGPPPIQQDHVFSINDGECLFQTASGFEDDRENIAEQLGPLAAQWDIPEPLDRIREAIQEAQRAAA